jgi:hypothetical protein
MLLQAVAYLRISQDPPALTETGTLQACQARGQLETLLSLMSKVAIEIVFIYRARI